MLPGKRGQMVNYSVFAPLRSALGKVNYERAHGSAALKTLNVAWVPIKSPVAPPQAPPAGYPTPAPGLKIAQDVVHDAMAPHNNIILIPARGIHMSSANSTPVPPGVDITLPAQPAGSGSQFQRMKEPGESSARSGLFRVAPVAR